MKLAVGGKTALTGEVIPGMMKEDECNLRLYTKTRNGKGRDISKVNGDNIKSITSLSNKPTQPMPCADLSLISLVPLALKSHVDMEYSKATQGAAVYKSVIRAQTLNKCTRRED